jgi:hypothetical protein
MRAWAALILAASCAASTARAADLPDGWRRPTAQELSGRPASETLAVSGDFDGDARPDEAVVLINDRRGRLGLFVMRGATGRFERLDLSETVSALPELGLVLEKPQAFVTACGKGYGGGCRRGEPARVEPRWTPIGVAYAEASYSIFYWDGRRFAHVFLSD